MVNNDNLDNTAKDFYPGKSLPEEPIRLPLSFYQKILNLPKCKVGEECDNCGRCEH